MERSNSSKHLSHRRGPGQADLRSVTARDRERAVDDVHPHVGRIDRLHQVSGHELPNVARSNVTLHLAPGGHLGSGIADP